jgi:protein tyrosine/serine phosphatase
MPAPVRALSIVLVIAVLIGGPLGYFTYREQMARSFHVVQEGVLYRSGQLTFDGFHRVTHDYNIRTVVCLRDGDREDDLDEEAFCRKVGITHIRIPPRSWWASKGPAPVEEGLKVFREVMRDPANYPVLIHCFAGLHRTGAYCAVYRMDFQGWSNEQALAEMKRAGYRTLDDDWDVLTFLENYRARPQAAIQPVSREKR